MSDKDDKKDRDRGDKDKRERRPPPERTGNVAPPDPALVEWLEKLWTRGNPPDRLEVWWMLGLNKDVRKDLVFYENFRQDDKLTIEQCTGLAGEIIKAVQDWTDSKRRLCDFEIAIIDHHQATAPLKRSIGPLLPRQAYAGVYPDGEPMGPGEEEEDGAIALKPLSHQYLRQSYRSLHKMVRETYAVIGDTMRLQQGIIVSQQSHNERLQNANMALYDQHQQALDRATERTMWVEREKMKIKAIGSGLKVGENLIYGWFGMPTNDNAGAPANDNGTGGAANDNGAVRRVPPSAEQRLVESFLEEAAEEKLSVQLFGDWKDKERLTLQEVFAGIGLEKPGIFSPQQFGILLAVRFGLLPPEALDALMHDFGPSPANITIEQLTQAQPLLTQGMRVALDQVRSLRLAAREKREALGEQAPPQNREQSK